MSATQTAEQTTEAAWAVFVDGVRDNADAPACWLDYLRAHRAASEAAAAVNREASLQARRELQAREDEYLELRHEARDLTNGVLSGTVRADSPAFAERVSAWRQRAEAHLGHQLTTTGTLDPSTGLPGAPIPVNDATLLAHAAGASMGGLLGPRPQAPTPNHVTLPPRKATSYSEALDQALAELDAAG